MTGSTCPPATLSLEFLTLLEIVTRPTAFQSSWRTIWNRCGALMVAKSRSRQARSIRRSGCFFYKRLGGVIGNQLIGPYFYRENLTGERHRWYMAVNRCLVHTSSLVRINASTTTHLSDV
uniref:Uncharacterized protein n=1 Tax=Rhodnius prolixus TaxID=13249 RepID=T1HK17_RHOPR